MNIHNLTSASIGFKLTIATICNQQTTNGMNQGVRHLSPLKPMNLNLNFDKWK